MRYDMLVVHFVCVCVCVLLMTDGVYFVFATPPYSGLNDCVPLFLWR